MIAASLALAATVIGFVFGAAVAGGSDSYGYVSQAHLWATGRMRDELRLADELEPLVRTEALVPLGYTSRPIDAPSFPLMPRACRW